MSLRDDAKWLHLTDWLWIVAMAVAVVGFPLLCVMLTGRPSVP